MTYHVGNRQLMDISVVLILREVVLENILPAISVKMMTPSMREN